MENRSYLNTKFLGLHTCRYQSALVIHPWIYHTLGNTVVQRDLYTFEIKNSFQVHNSMISAFVPRPRINPTSLIIVDYYGNIAVHSLQGEFLAYLRNVQSKIPAKCVRYTCSNDEGSLIAVLSTGGNSYNGIIEVYKVTLTNTIEKIREFRGNYKQCDFINSTDLFALRENFISGEIPEKPFQKFKTIAPELALQDFFSETEEDEDPEALLQSFINGSKRIVNYYACVFYNVEHEKRGKAELKDIYSRVNLICKNHSGKVAFATLNRVIYVMEMITLTVLHQLTLKGGGSLCMVIFEGNDLYFSPMSHYFCKFNTEQPQVFKEFAIPTEANDSELVCVKTAHKWIHKNNYLAWGIKDKVLISLNEYGIFKGEFVDFPNSNEITNFKKEQIFQISCCGLDIHSSLPYVAVGDLSGGIFIFDYSQNLLISEAVVEGSIRCLLWKNNVLYIGTMEGLIFLWDYSNNPIIDLFFMIGEDESVICMALKNDTIAVGCKNGEIWLFSEDSQKKFLAHEPKETDDERFGSLGLFSEIWSITWSPCGKFLASASEDQSVRVWDIETHLIIAELPKHKRAVTGVRWEKIQELVIHDQKIDEIFISCSDDENLRVYNPKNWEILHVLNTSIIQEWHTITYAAIEKGGKRVACVTQNGFLFVLDLGNLQIEIIERIHNGSIEGFDWKEKMITCSSEGICCVIDLAQN